MLCDMTTNSGDASDLLKDLASLAAALCSALKALLARAAGHTTTYAASHGVILGCYHVSCLKALTIHTTRGFMALL
jgi:hypothetical protein